MVDPIRVLYVLTQGIVTYLGFVMVARFLFFEKGIAGKESITFHLITLFGIMSASFPDKGGFVPTFVLIMGILWLFFGGTERHVWKIFLSVPILGIVYGIFIPVVVLPGFIINFKSNDLQIFQIIMHSVVTIVLALIMKKFSKSEDVYSNEIVTVYSDSTAVRRLSKVEYGLLCFVGLFELVISTRLGIEAPFEIQTWISGMAISQKDYFMILLSISISIMTIIVITIVLAGNRRVYYSDKISDMQFNIIAMMAEIVENRDENTGGHIQRTAKYVEIIAQNLKRGPYKEYMTDQFINDIKVAAPLHDIGKIHVSDLILNKPGKLTSEEFEIMKTHSDEGRKLLTHAKAYLGEFSYLDMAIDMAASHHEWWDGSVKGYPDHLSGEDIPLSARIMAVADVFDALTAKRCYKEAMPIKKAIKIIKSENGTHFDPIVVDAFLDSMDKIEEAFRYFEDNTSMDD